LLTTIAGFLPAQDGKVSVAGEPLRNGHPTAASNAGLVLVPDDRALFFTLTVDENLRAAQGQHATQPDDQYDLFPPLAHRRNLLAGKLSGGEQQMLAMARALMQDPRVLLIDEMSMGLAPVVVEELLPLVRSIASERAAVVVLVEQHVGLALEVADRAVVLAHGQVVLDGSTMALRADPQRFENAYFGRSG
jgi:branched-chain amino acid transport system ATP-binding protein